MAYENNAAYSDATRVYVSAGSVGVRVGVRCLLYTMFYVTGKQKNPGLNRQIVVVLVYFASGKTDIWR